MCLPLKSIVARHQRPLGGSQPPSSVIRFRFDELQDAVRGACHLDPREYPVIRRRPFDVRSFQKGCKDGPFSVEESSRPC